MKSKLVLLVVAVVCLGNVLTQSTCPADQINCQACNDPTVPKSPLEGYSRISIPGAMAAAQTPLADQRKSNPDLSKMIQAATNKIEVVDQDKEIEAYVSGLALYIALPIWILVLLFPLTFFFCCGRYCCFCCEAKCLGCGKMNPTQDIDACSSCCSCCCGFKFDPETKKGYYPLWQKLVAYLLMLAFIGLIAGFVSTAFVNGTSKLSTGMTKLAVEAPAGVANLVYSTQTPAKVLVAKTLIPSLISLITAVNETIGSTIDIRGATNDIRCILKIKDDNIPHFDVIKGVVNKAKDLLTSLPNATVISVLDGKFNTAKVGIKSSSSTLRTVLYKIGNVTTFNFIPYFDASDLDLAQAKTNITILKSEANNINTNYTNKIDPLLDASTTSTLDSLKTTLSDLSTVSGTNDATKNGNRDTLKSNIDSLKVKADNAAAGSAAIQVSITAIKVKVDNTKNNLNDLITQMTAVSNKINTLPTGGELNSGIDGLDSSLNLIPISDFKGLILGLNATIKTEISLAPINAQLTRFLAVVDKFPCADRLAGLMTSVNASIFTIPAGIPTNVTGLISPHVETARGFTTTIDNFQGTINNMTKNFQPLIDEAYKQVDSVDTQLKDAGSKFSVAKLGSSNLDSAKTNLPNLANSKTIIDSIQSPSVDAENSIIDLNAKTTSLSSQLANALSSITTWETTKYCICNGPIEGCAGYTRLGATCADSTFCQDVANGGGSNSICEGALYPGYCTTNGTPDLTKSCTQPTDCVGPAACNVPDFSAITKSIDDAKLAISSASGQKPNIAIDDSSLSSTETALTSGRSAVNNMKTSAPDVNGIIANLDMISSQLDDPAMNVTTNLAQVTEFSGQTLPDLNFPIDLSMLDLIKGFTGYLDLAVDMIFTSLPNLFTYMSTDNLNSKATLKDLLAYIVPAYENLVIKLNGTAGALPSLRKILYVDSKEYLDALTLDPKLYGSTFYLYNLYHVVTFNTSASAETGPIRSGPTILFTSLNKKRDSNDLCLTKDCIQNTVEEVFNTGVGKIMTKYGVSGVPESIPSINDTFNALILIQLLPAVLGLLAMVWVCSVRFNPALCACYVGCCFLIPLCIVSLLLLPTLMVMTDGCRSGEKIGAAYIKQNTTGLCTTLKGVSSGPLCKVSFNVQNSTISLDIDIVKMYSDILSPTCDDSNNALRTALLSLKNQKNSIVQSQIDNFMPMLTGFGAKSKVVNAVNGQVTTVANNIDAFVDSLIDTMSCKAVGNSMRSVKDGMCCYVINPWATIASCLFGLILTFAFVGPCAGICGKKRFALEPFGKYYDNAKLAADNGIDDARGEGTRNQLIDNSRQIEMSPTGGAFSPGGQNEPGNKNFKFSPLAGGATGALTIGGQYDLESFEANAVTPNFKVEGNYKNSIV